MNVSAYCLLLCLLIYVILLTRHNTYVTHIIVQLFVNEDI